MNFQHLVRQRQELRLQLLFELYQHHHATGGREKVERAAEMDCERSLAYRYLAEKGYARKATEGMGYTAAMSRVVITALGIDFIEQQIISDGLDTSPKVLPESADS